MSNLLSLTTTQLRRAADLKGKIEALQKQLASILGPAAAPAPKKQFKMSAAARAKIAAAQKARWAKVKKPAAKKRAMSAAVKAKLSALAKARWAKVKKTGKKSL
jgi:hypothetical protein